MTRIAPISSVIFFKPPGSTLLALPRDNRSGSPGVNQSVLCTMTIRAIDLNADLGEGCPWDEAILARVSSASVSCGGHAGSPDAIEQTLRWAIARAVVVGAHPGYADRDGFGRRELNLTDPEIQALIVDQLDQLAGWARAVGTSIRFVKPHGALYNQAQRDRRIATALVAALVGRDLPILGQPGGAVEQAARDLGVRFVSEGFADRRYRPDGRLLPRTEPGAILHDPAEIRAQVLDLVDRGIDTLCIHGDDPRSVELADLVRDTLAAAEVTVRGFA